MNNSRIKRLSGGFTLLEIAVVLFIVGLMIAGLLSPLGTQLESRDRRQTQETLDQIVDALYGYAMTNGRLPCPDKPGSGDGVPDPDATSVNCDVSNGFVPWAELGIPAGDAWGNRISYAVSSPTYTSPESDGLCNGDSAAPKHFDLCAKGILTITTRGDDAATAGITEGKHELTNATQVPAVLVSHGRNGYGATSIDGTLRSTPSGLDEIENSGGTATKFVTRVYSRGSTDCDDIAEGKTFCEFDDIVVWLAPTILNARMVGAGRLP